MPDTPSRDCGFAASTGENACPPEDVGGPGGYADFLTAIADPRHDEHERFLSWVGGSFDPARFDVTAVNLLLDDIKP
jgi:hypothetical protein